MKISADKFGVTPLGEQVDIVTIENKIGAKIKVTSFGAKLVSLVVPDSNGILGDVVLGYNNLESYLSGQRFFGSNPGPFANRIKDASFSIDGQAYHFTPNDGPNLLHSGAKGIDSAIWTYEMENNAVTFTYTSPDGEYGFPGDLTIAITYTWGNDCKLAIEYRATTSKATHLNLTHHSYFNLNGESSQTILDHIISVNADSYLETDELSVPTGNILSVANTPLDLREGKVIGDVIFSDFEPMVKVSGFDHCYVISRDKESLAHCAHVEAPLSGRSMDVYTTMPGVQLYTDNHENGETLGKSGKIYPKRCAFCIEPQFYPNSPNIASFPSTLLRPDEEYNQTIVYQFN